MMRRITFLSMVIMSSAILCVYSQNADQILKTIEVDKSIHLHNLHQYNNNLFSGSEPADESAFKKLNELGVKTIISVDGAKPKLDLAHKYGMRYVHIPIQYSGINEEQSCSLAKAVRDMTGPIYVHCHHGKHRGPAAASLSLVLLGVWDNQTAIKALEESGTGKHYVGLYQTANDAKELSKEFLDNYEVEFVETAVVSSMVEAMGQMQSTYDHLQLCKENGWRTPADHPDVNPAHEALQLREQFHEFLRSGPAKNKDVIFKNMAQNSETAAYSLENAIREWKPETADEEPPITLNNMLNRVTRSCGGCHTVYRNSPDAAAKNQNQ